MKPLKIVVFGLSITSAWGNGHATTFRSLLKALAARGHDITFFEKDVPWYRNSRDLPNPPFCATVLYDSVEQLERHSNEVEAADLVILGSYVADSAALVDWVRRSGTRCFAFYDIDTPVTLARLAAGECEYLTQDMIPIFDVYLSFTGGPTLKRLERDLHAQRARPLYCSVDVELYFPEPVSADERSHYELGYLGTYSIDRQPTLQKLLIEPAQRLKGGRFCVAGAQYPSHIQWPANVERIEHIAPDGHRSFYNAQAFTLNVTRDDMVRAGYSPSVRLFEAAACGTPIISDAWEGLDTFFTPDEEILIAEDPDQVLSFLRMPEERRRAISERARSAVLKAHTSAHRATELENYWLEVTSPPLSRGVAYRDDHSQGPRRSEQGTTGAD